jgi:hypothetical protein|tara:strand:- start:339 stop:491 length:153 start_codon:yes stop_codon:yes gene_type:complete
MKRKTYERNRSFTGRQSESLFMNKRELKKLIRKQIQASQDQRKVEECLKK